MTVENSLPTPPSTTYTEVKKPEPVEVADAANAPAPVVPVADPAPVAPVVAVASDATEPTTAEPSALDAAPAPVTDAVGVEEVAVAAAPATEINAPENNASTSAAEEEPKPTPAPAAPAAPAAVAPSAFGPAPVYAPGTAHPRPHPQPVVPVPAPVEPVAVFTRDQHKHAFNLIRSLKKNKNSGPFFAPVDAVALHIPDYYRIIKNPMELQTVESKVAATGKAITAASKLNRVFGLDYTDGSGHWEGLSGDVYRTVDDLKRDLDQIWTNCYTFNGQNSIVGTMAQSMAEHSERLFKNMPPSKPLLPTDSQATLNRASASTPQPNHLGGGEVSRPRRDIHAPPRDLPYNVESAKKLSRSDKVLQEQLRFAKEVIREMFKRVHEAYAFPFLQPVDITLYPQYSDVVKRPMDFGTIKNRLERNEYELPLLENVERDARQVFDNCYAFNPAGTPVNDMGRKLEAVFDAKWNDQPDFAALAHSKAQTHSTTRYEEDYDDEFYSDSEDDVNISAMEKQVRALQATIESLKKKNKRSNKRKSSTSLPQAKKSKSSHVSGTTSTYNKPRKSVSSEIVTYEMKRDLATKIVRIDGDNLQSVIEIIKSGRPDLIGGSNQEIELDIDTLDPPTLYKLYDFVCNGNAPKQRAKRRAMDETKESQKIQQLEEQIRQFEKPAQFDQDQASSDSSDDDSSDSDSE